MIAKKGESRLAKSLQLIARRRQATVPDCHADCSQPDASADLPTTHGLMLASIEGRILKLEQQISNQNRILIIGIVAVVGDLVKQMLIKP